MVAAHVDSAREFARRAHLAVSDLAARGAVAVHVGSGVPRWCQRRIRDPHQAARAERNIVVGVLAKKLKSVVVLAREGGRVPGAAHVAQRARQAAHVLKLLGESKAVKALGPKHFGGVAHLGAQ